MATKKTSFGRLMLYIFGPIVLVVIVLIFVGFSMKKNQQKPTVIHYNTGNSQTVSSTSSSAAPAPSTTETISVSVDDARLRFYERKVESLEQRVLALEGRFNSSSSSSSSSSFSSVAIKKISATNRKTSEQLSSAGYKVDAVVAHRAFLSTTDGKNITVIEGDKIPVKTLKIIEVNNEEKTVITTSDH